VSWRLSGNRGCSPGESIGEASAMKPSALRSCVNCGYVIVSLEAEASRCPECGRDPAERDLQSVSKPWGATVGALCGLVAGLGALVFFLAAELAPLPRPEVALSAVIMAATAGGIEGRLYIARRIARQGRDSELEPVIGFLVFCGAFMVQALIVGALATWLAEGAPLETSPRMRVEWYHVAMMILTPVVLLAIPGIPLTQVAHMWQWGMASRAVRACADDLKA